MPEFVTDRERIQRLIEEEDAHDDHAVDEVMGFGTTTVRPSEDLEALLGRMREADVEHILVTRSDGTFVGVLGRDQAERVR